MIKALIEVSKVDITDLMVVYDYLILQWVDKTITAERVRRAFIDVSVETGVDGQNLMGDQRSEPVVIANSATCATFLDLLGDYNKEGKLENVKEF
jgi:hypothetical protein